MFERDAEENLDLSRILARDTVAEPTGTPRAKSERFEFRFFTEDSHSVHVSLKVR